ncbi:sugar phosphate isomerase/epimerase family protein, partial [Acinetobacter baumannii]|uniref:sugar phosphate isomerase/epimerase family protein n=1 Tax=Acinetobacter baumannii TaxID=470 RepID=UPI001AECFEE9
VEIVEIRREFLDPDRLKQELEEIRQEALKNNMILFYSVNEDFFVEGNVNPDLSIFLKEAKVLGAERVKFNFGIAPTKYSKELTNKVSEIDKESIKINIENNQVASSCNINDMRNFFEFSSKENFSFNFCFDLANWAWTGTSLTEAVDKIGKYADYIHLKNYHLVNEKLIVTSLCRG